MSSAITEVPQSSSTIVVPKQQAGNQKHTIAVIKPINEYISETETMQKMEGDALITIDGVLVAVKIHTRAKRKGSSTDPFEGAGTWTVMRFDKPEIRKHPDYKAIWKEVFFALRLNWNERGFACEKRELQRDWTGTKIDACDCKECKTRKEREKKLQQEAKQWKPSEPLQEDENGDIHF